MSLQFKRFLIVGVLALSALPLSAQMPNPYGAPVNGENAKKIATAALAEARKNGWNMAAAVVDATENDGALAALAGGGIRGMVRLAAGDYSMWRDIAITNSKNLQDALLRMEQKLAHIRENLNTRELQSEFDRAHELDLDTPAEERRKKDDGDPPKFW